jgi:hypothetical protein
MYLIKKFIIFVVSFHAFFLSFSMYPSALSNDNNSQLSEEKARATKEQINQTVVLLRKQYSADFLRNCATLLLKKSSTADRANAFIALCTFLHDNPYLFVKLQSIFTILKKADSQSIKEIFGKFSQLP